MIAGLIVVLCALGAWWSARAGRVAANAPGAKLAMLDGYYREAVSGFHTALERLYDFYLRTVLQEQGIVEGESAKAWRLSGRTYGAFLAAYLSQTKTASDPLPNSQVELRNSVTHTGYLPTRKEALDRGDDANVTYSFWPQQ